MTFLNPFVLFGLAAAAIPILLHLLNKRKLRTVEFSSLTFLKELQKSTMRKITIRQWLLLLLRTLFVILVVLAFSRPVLRGTLAGFGSHAKTTIALILDDSYSMSLQNNNDTYLKQERAAALRVLDMMKNGDDAILVKLSDVPDATIGEPVHDAASVRSPVQSMSVGVKHRTIEDAVRLTSRLLSRSKNFNKEVYIITDAQRSTFVNTAAGQASDTTLKLFDAQTKLFVIPLNDKQFENCAVEKVTIASPLLQTGKPVAIQAAVKNFGTAPVANRLASLVVNGTRIMQKTVSIARGSSSAVEFTFTPSRPGFQQCSIVLEDDVLEADNKYYFTLYVPERITVALVADDASQTLYLRAALTALAGAGGPAREAYALAVRELLPSQLTSSSLADADVVLLCGVKDITRTTAQAIAGAMQDGTGVLFFPGSAMEAARWNADFFPTFDLPAVKTSSKTGIADSTATSFEKVDFDHPLFKGIFDVQMGRKTPQIESPKIVRQMRFASLQSLRPIITTGSGNYFLWEKKFGRGSILGFSVPLTDDASDFAVKPIFIPVLSQSILHITSMENAAMLPGVIGEPVDPRTLLIPRSARSAHAALPLRVFDTQGNETRFAESLLDVRSTAALAAWLTEHAALPGFYCVTQGRDTVTVIGMNMNGAESDGAILPSSEMLSAVRKFGGTAELLAPGASIDTAVLESRFGVELWKYFLVFAALIALAEMLIAREKHE